MRVIVCGDSHIGAVFGLGKPKKDGGNTRVDDYEKSLNSIIDYAIDSSADIFVQTGDIFDSRTPSSENMEVVNRAFKKLSKKLSKKTFRNPYFPKGSNPLCFAMFWMGRPGNTWISNVLDHFWDSGIRPPGPDVSKYLDTIYV